MTLALSRNAVIKSTEVGREGWGGRGQALPLLGTQHLVWILKEMFNFSKIEGTVRAKRSHRSLETSGLCLGAAMYSK